MKRIIILIVLLAVLAVPGQAAIHEINGTQYFSRYDGERIPESAINDRIEYDFSNVTWNIYSLAGQYRVLPSQTFDYIIDPLTGQTVSTYSEWKAEYWKTTGQGSWTQHGIISKTVTLIDSKTLLRSMKTTEGTWFNVTYRLVDHKLKIDAYIDGYGKKEQIIYSIDFNNGRTTSIDPNSKRFNINLSNTLNNVIFDYSDIGNNHNVTSSITQGNRFNLNVLLDNGSIIPSGSKSGFDPIWTIDTTTTSSWTTSNISLNGTMQDGTGLRLNYRNDSALNISGLVAAYSLGASSGTVACNMNTESGLCNATNQGTLVNMNTGLNNCTGNCSGWNSSGRLGNGLSFDGVNDYVNAGNDASLRTLIDNNYTIITWIKSSTTISLRDVWHERSVGAGAHSVILNYPSTGKIAFFTGSATAATSSITSNLNNGVWRMVAVELDNSSTKIYIDGIIDANGSKTTGSYANTSFFIGSNNDNTRFFNGSIDEVRIYNRALSASEIAVLYNTSLRTTATLNATNQTATTGNVINRTRVTFKNNDSLTNASIVGKVTGTSDWAVIKSVAENYTWYDTNTQYNSMDLGVWFQGNGSNSSIVQSLEWDETAAAVVQNYIPPIPSNLASTQGNFWVNYTWQAGAGNVTDSYNVSNNGIWTNGSALNYSNQSLDLNLWGNITVQAYNSSGTGTLNATDVNQSTQMLRSYTPDAPAMISSIITEDYINQSWQPQGINTTDSYNFSVNGAWTNLSLLTYVNNSYVAGQWQNITVHAINQSAYAINQSLTALTNNSQVPYPAIVNYLPTTPVSLTYSSGNFWINYTWLSGSGNITDSYNVSMNGIWTNTSLLNYLNSSFAQDEWKNISVYAFNNSGTGTLNQTPASMNTSLHVYFTPNKPINCRSTNGTNYIHVICDPDPIGNVTDTFYFVNNTIAYGTADNFWNNTGLGEGYNDSYDVYAYNNSNSSIDFVTIANTTLSTIIHIYIPPTPINLIYSSGEFWINYTYSSGAGNVTDSFNTSINGAWTNNSMNYRNASFVQDEWKNISVYSYNNSGTGTLNQTPVSMNTSLHVYFTPPTPASCTSMNGTDYIVISCTPGSGNVTTSFYYNNLNTSDVMNSAMSWNNTGLTPGLKYYYEISGLNASNFSILPFYLSNTTIAMYNQTLPNITAYFNNYTGWNQTALTVNVSNAVFFNVTANQSISNVSFKIDGIIQQNTSSLNWSYLWPSVGSFNVTMQANNSNGTSQIVYTVVTVVEGGSSPPCCGGGIDWDYAYGWAKYLNGTGISGVTVTTTQGITTTNGAGYYSFGYIFVHGTNYSFNFTKTGYDYNATYGNFIGADFQIVNGTMNGTIIPPPDNPPYIIGWENNATNSSVTTIYINKSTVEFNFTANQTLTGCAWTGVDGTINCTAQSSYAYKNFTNAGLFSVTAQGSNPNGSTQVITWTVIVNATVLTISGYVMNVVYDPIKAKITTNDGYIAISNATTGYFSILTASNPVTLIVEPATIYRKNTTSFSVSVPIMNITVYEKSQTSAKAPGFEGIFTLIVICVLIFFRKDT